MDPLNYGAPPGQFNSNFSSTDLTKSMEPMLPSGKAEQEWSPSPKLFFVLVLVLMILAFIFYIYARSRIHASSNPPIVTMSPVRQPEVVYVTTPAPKPSDKVIPDSVVCQEISDTFGTRPNNDARASGAYAILETWKENQCTTVPSNWTCQDISDAYYVGPNSSPSKPGVSAYRERRCNTEPQYTCQRLSNDYGIRPGSWENAAPSVATGVRGDVVRDAWRNRNCQTVPTFYTCQDLSNIYSIEANETGIAPPSIFGTYRSKGCSTSPMSCQYISDVYGVGANRGTFDQPSDRIQFADKAWANQKCKSRAPPDGYVTSLIDAKFNTGKDIYSSGKLQNCLDQCTPDNTCDVVEFDAKSGKCVNKTEIDFNGETSSAEDTFVYKKRENNSA